MATRARTRRIADAAASRPIVCDLYLRLSDGRNEGSFADREKALRRKALQLGWTVRNVVIENDLMDGRKSASAFKRRKVRMPDGSIVMRVVRPGFRKLLDDLATGAINAMLAEALDRAMRDPRDLEDLIDVVEARNLNVDTVSGSLRFTDGGTDAEISMARGMVNHANLSSRDTARRVAGGRERTAERAGWAGGRRPYGFDTVPHPSGGHQNSVLVVNEAEAEEIRKAARGLLQEEPIPLKAIARGMNSRGVPTVTGVRWTAETLRTILLRELNAGIVVYLGEKIAMLPGDPILEYDEWQAVVAHLNDPSRATPGRAQVWQGTGVYRCVCGSPYEIQSGTTRAPTYRCSRKGGTGGAHTRRNAALLDDYVSRVVVARLSAPDAIDLFRCDKAKIDVQALRRKAAALRVRLADLGKLFAQGEIEASTLTAGTKEIKAQLSKVEAELADVSQSTSPAATLARAPDVQAAWDALTATERKAVIKALLTVTVLPDDRPPFATGFNPDAVRIEAAV